MRTRRLSAHAKSIDEREAAHGDAGSAISASQVKDAPQAVDFDFGVAIQHVDSCVDCAVRLLPNIVVALIVHGISVVVDALRRRLVESRAQAAMRQSW